MISTHRKVLVVAPAGSATSSVIPLLEQAGYRVTAVQDFSAAKASLASGPELLITELKLGAYNGLHLAIRARARNMPVLVVGHADPVQQAEADRQKAAYLVPPLADDRLLGVVRDLLTAAQHTRRSPRKQVPMVDILVNEAPARLIDVSYEGLRLEAASERSRFLPASFTVSLPHFNFSCDVERIWTTSRDGSAVSYGAELLPRNADTLLAWRSLVDALPGLAVTAYA
jgi:CheY-like chemotaxis protein